ncbi:MAG: cyclic nucleotide-binding/CBS domain-containing protein [Rhodobacterales bacterium]
MASQSIRPGTRLMDRSEYPHKPRPLTSPPDRIVADAVAEMSEKNYGCVVITDPDDVVIGIVTERDIMIKLVGKGKDPNSTKLSDIMTKNPRVAREDDSMLDWMRMMSNERFRRLPVVDDQGRIKVVFTQGDFVSYTWPDTFQQAKSIAKAALLTNLHLVLIVGGILIYALGTLIIFAAR